MSQKSVTSCQLKPPNIPIERKPPLHGSGNLKSQLQTAAQSIDVCLFIYVYIQQPADVGLPPIQNTGPLWVSARNSPFSSVARSVLL